MQAENLNDSLPVFVSGSKFLLGPMLGRRFIKVKKWEGKTLRLDKYLKVSRLIKRRTVANEACDGGRVMINDKPAKASSTVKVGDIITISFGNKEVKVRVLDVQETVRKEAAGELFEYL